MQKTISLGAFALFTTTSLAFAAGGHDGGHGSNDTEIGQPGETAEVARKIEVSMDGMDYDPDTIKVTAGETVRFVVTNKGRMVHEFSIGSDAIWDAHRDEMQEMRQSGVLTTQEIRREKMIEAGMMHDDANSVILEPGETAEVVWTFPEGGTVGFACNVPGHREAGMEGEFLLTGDDENTAS